MAPFNKRQIGYIQAIAGRQQHVTLICGQRDDFMKSYDTISSENIPKQIRLARCGTGANGQIAGVDVSAQPNAKSLFLHTWDLDLTELGFDSRDVQNNAKLEGADFQHMSQCSYGMGNRTGLNCFYAPVSDHSVQYNSEVVQDRLVEGVPDPRCTSVERLTQDGFLNSTDCKFRFVLPANIGEAMATSNHPMGQSHYEFRWIVWRHKKPTVPHPAASASNYNLDAIRDGASFRNPGYDFWMGQTGRKRGFLGYTLNAKLDRDKFETDSACEAYSGDRYRQSGEGTPMFLRGWRGDSDNYQKPDGEEKFTVDDLLTMRINKDDYVVMKDVRFFLGKEHGKSHFEDHLHWDWNDPIDTPEKNVLASPTLNNKNYRWHMTLIGTNGGTDNPVVLNSHVRWTTKMESG